MKCPPVLLTALMIILFSLPAAGEDAKTVKITCDPWPPWIESQDGVNPTGGIFFLITKEVFRRAHLAYTIEIVPFQRCLYQLRTGKRDVMLMVSRTPEREEFMEFSDIVINDPYYLYYCTERIRSFEWTAWKDLENRTIGVVSGFNYGTAFLDASKEFNIRTDGSSTDVQNIRKLLKGRFDFIILNKANADRIAQQYPGFMDTVRRSEKVLHEGHYRFAFSKKSPFLPVLPRINSILQEIRSDGTLERIVRTHRLAFPPSDERPPQTAP